ncbi:hypothetical protein [Stieleria varia]|uniref:Uncharacterized protein n=1 Tax=Stieleria varia TaxID=2528005 RepID=A0A5C6A0R9_9BACT|nr:hypothetical protein [Stieleria varia]TWT92798.1 hypothetical protein Pla52n_61630 [Stieleria varia]
MSQLVARIALLGYLVGGLLLPAMHHHGHHVATGGSVSCCHVDATDHDHQQDGDRAERCESLNVAVCDAEPSPDCCGGCCSSFTPSVASACQPSEAAEVGADCSDGSTVPQYDRGSHHECSDLCLLCTARTLTTDRVTVDATITGIVIVTDIAAVSDAPLLPLLLSSANLTRGPPMNALRV